MVFLKKALSIFRNHENYEPDSETTALQDARELVDSVDRALVKAAFELYVTIKQESEEYDSETSQTRAFDALEKLVALEGDFGRFEMTERDLEMLTSLQTGFLVYDDVLHVLIDHHQDVEAANRLFQAHPELHEHLPEQYDNAQELIHVLVEVVKDYQWQLEHFYTKHRDAIDLAVHDTRIGLGLGSSLPSAQE